MNPTSSLSPHHILVEVSSVWSSWSVAFDLEHALCIRWGGELSAPHKEPVKPAVHKRLQAEARAAFARGSFHRRVQFANGCVQFALTFDGQSVVQTYESENSKDYRGVQTIWKYACRKPSL